MPDNREHSVWPKSLLRLRDFRFLITHPIVGKVKSLDQVHSVNNI